MKQKGFTLVELLGVLAILSIILIVTVPAITSSLKRGEKTKYDSFVDNILSSTELYVESNRELFPELKEERGISSVSLKELIENGYLKESTINPKTNQKVKPNDLVAIQVKEDTTFYYEYPVERKTCHITLSTNESYIENNVPYFLVTLSNGKDGTLIEENLNCTVTIQNILESTGLYSYIDEEGNESETYEKKITTIPYQFGTAVESKQIKVFVKSEKTEGEQVNFKVRTDYGNTKGQIQVD